MRASSVFNRGLFIVIDGISLWNFCRELIEKNSGYTVMPELGTKPQVFYLPPKNRLFPYQYDEESTGAEELHG